MIPVLIGAVAGMWVAGRGRPKTRIIKRECLGSRSGVVYECEEFPEAGLLMLTVQGKCKVVLERAPLGGFIVRKANGTPDMIEAVKNDFGPGTPKPKPPSEET